MPNWTVAAGGTMPGTISRTEPSPRMAAMTGTDQELLGRVAAHDRDAFAVLYDRYAPRALGLILRILGNRTDAEDVLQETFLQVWNQAERFDPGRSSPDVWVLLLARSRAVDRLRKRAVVTSSEVPEPADGDDPGAGVARAEEAEQVHAALAHLPPDQREPIRLSFFGGLTHEEIAARLKVPLGTIKTRIRLGMARLRERFTAPAPSEGTVL